MANNPSTLVDYNGQVDAPSSEFPYGSARDDAVPGDLTGTPRVAAELKDIEGLQQSLLVNAGIVPSGVPDEVGASQYLQALMALSGVVRLTVAAMIADAELLPGAKVSTVTYHATGLDGGAAYLIKTAAQAATDGDTIDGFGNHTLTNTHKAILQHSGSVWGSQFGAKGDGSDDFASLDAMKEFANSQVQMFLDGSKTYSIGTEWDLKHSTNSSVGPKLQGNYATIKALGAMGNVVSVTGGTKIKTRIRDLVIDADNLATRGFSGIFITEFDSLVRNVRVSNAIDEGHYYDACQVARFEGLVSQSNGADGILIESCNGSLFTSPRSVANGGKGIQVARGATNFTGGCTILNPNCEVNAEEGIDIVDTASPVLVQGGWLESNVKDGVIVSGAASGAIIKNVGIIGGDAGNLYRAVVLSALSKGCTVTDNRFQFTAGTTFNQVIDNAPVGINDTYPNYIRSTGAIIGEEKVLAPSTAVNQVGSQGMLSGGIAISVGAVGSKTFKFTPSGTFNIPGANDRGAYYIELDLIGYFTGIDQTVFKRFRIYAGTLDGALHDGSISEEVSVGDAARAADLTATAPTIDGATNNFEVVVSNAEANSFDGYYVWRAVTTTTKLDVSVA